jgi:hypothetical protein
MNGVGSKVWKNRLRIKINSLFRIKSINRSIASLWKKTIHRKERKINSSMPNCRPLRFVWKEQLSSRKKSLASKMPLIPKMTSSMTSNARLSHRKSKLECSRLNLNRSNLIWITWREKAVRWNSNWWIVGSKYARITNWNSCRARKVFRRLAKSYQ